MRRRGFALGLLLAGILTACTSPATIPQAKTATTSNEPIKIGGIFDLTGITADVGVPYAKGATAYIDWFNSQGGANGRLIELKSADYAYKVETAEQLYAKNVNVDNVVAMIGWGTADTEVLRPKIAADKLPFVSASLSEKLADVKTAPYNFVVGVNYSDQMRIALQYMLRQKNNAKGIKVAFLYNDSGFGKSPEPALDEFAARSGMQTLKIVMPRSADDLTPQLQQVQAFGADYVIVQNTTEPAALALRNADAINLRTQFIMLNFAANEQLIDRAGAAADGVIGVIPFAPPSSELAAVRTINSYLQSKAQGAVSDKDKGLLFSQGWTIMSVMAEGIKRAAANGEVTGEAIRAELERLHNFDTGGITAPITFGPEDHQGATALRLYQVQGGQWTPLTGMIEAMR